jgi:hypothetical protein
MLSIVMLRIIIIILMRGIMLKIVLPIVVRLNVIMLSVGRGGVVMLNVVALPKIFSW